MKTRLALMLLNLLILNLGIANGKTLKGTATSLDGKTVLYTEVHQITEDAQGLNQKIETTYLKPDGTVFAKMVSDFSKSAVIPEVVFTDTRFDKTEELNFKDVDKKKVIFKTTLKKDKVSVKEHSVKPEMAAGQGFDNFVKKNFDGLTNSTVPLSFGVLSEMDFYSFNGYKRADVNEQVVQFGIKLSSLFLRLFADELILEYDKQSRQILSYRGLSNLLTDEGKTQNVLIKYQVESKVAGQ